MSKEIYDALLRQWMQVDELEDVERELEGQQLTPVDSSNLAAVGYDSKKRELVVAFLDGSIYRYFDVSRQRYQALMNADSHGSYFYHKIRLEYAYERIAG